MLMYVSFLRFLYLKYQNNHWQVSGKNFYQNHLLFQRLYESVAADTDMAAEKTAGLFSAESLDFEVQLNNISTLCKTICKNKNSDLIAQALELEEEFSRVAEVVYSKLKELNEITLGLDDMIMGHVSNSEERIYLLKQSL